MLIPVLALLSATSFQAWPPEHRTFQDWTVGCDNVRRCEAVALLPERGEGEGQVTMSLARDADAEAHVILSLDQEEAPQPAALMADGVRLQVRLRPVASGVAVEPADLPTLMRAFRSARALTAVNAGGTRLGIVSLAGATAALRFIDEAQRRTGTVTALIDRGDRAATAVPPPPVPPQVRVQRGAAGAALAIPPSRIATLRRQTECDIDDGDDHESAETFPLGGGKTLLLLSCGHGAYNFTVSPFIVERRGARLDIQSARFDRGVETDGSRPLLTNVDWDAGDRILTEAPRGRGLGDCGARSSYAWDGQRFRLISQEVMGECRGSTNFIRTWHAQVVR